MQVMISQMSSSSATAANAHQHHLCADRRRAGPTSQLQQSEQTNGEELGIEKLVLLCSLSYGSQQCLNLVAVSSGGEL